MSKKDEGAAKRPAYVTCCAGCADKLERLYYLHELPEEPRPGQCQLCQKYHHLSTYRLSPIRRYYKSYTGGGERARAGAMEK